MHINNVKHNYTLVRYVKQWILLNAINIEDKIIEMKCLKVKKKIKSNVKF